MDLFGHKAPQAELTAAITHLTEAVAGLHSRLNVLDRRIEQAHVSISAGSQENRAHGDLVLTAIAEHSRQIQGLKDEHVNVRQATRALRHVIEHVPVPGTRQVPSRG